MQPTTARAQGLAEGKTKLEKQKTTPGGKKPTQVEYIYNFFFVILNF